jgi:hypothetical protein
VSNYSYLFERRPTEGRVTQFTAENFGDFDMDKYFNDKIYSYYFANVLM